MIDFALLLITYDGKLWKRWIQFNSTLDSNSMNIWLKLMSFKNSMWSEKYYKFFFFIRITKETAISSIFFFTSPLKIKLKPETTIIDSINGRYVCTHVTRALIFLGREDYSLQPFNHFCYQIIISIWVWLWIQSSKATNWYLSKH